MRIRAREDPCRNNYMRHNRRAKKLLWAYYGGRHSHCKERRGLERTKRRACPQVDIAGTDVLGRKKNLSKVFEAGKERWW